MQSYTHRDLAQALGVSETTIKSYRAKFPGFLPVAREGKPVRLHPEALDVCRRIRDIFADGLSISQATAVLRTEFKEYPRNRRLPTTQKAAPPSPPGEALAPGESDLAQRIEALTQAQNQARGRMELLELEVRNLATMEAASKALIAELLAELRAARATLPTTAAAVASGNGATLAQHADAPGHSIAPAETAAPAGRATSAASDEQKATAPTEGVGTAASRAQAQASDPASEDAPTVLTARKIVTLHGPGGPVASYALGREPKPEPHFPEAPAPLPAFLDLPAVIRSDRGDFLGLPGGQSVRRLVEVLTPEGATPPAWFQESPEAWTCAIPLGRAQNRELLFERTTTPRGNLVGLIRRMRINETEATPMQLQEIFRQLRDQLT